MSQNAIIQQRTPGLFAYLAGAWRERHLLWFFARDAMAKFSRDTIIGWPWLFLRPLLPTLMFAFLFQGVKQLQTAPMPYLLYVLTGMILVQTASFSLRRIVRSLSSNSSIISKKYFPRILIPLAYLVPFVLQIGAGILLLFIVTVILILTGEDVTIASPLMMPWALLGIAIVLGFTLSLGSILALLNTAARDVRMTLPLLMAGLMFLSPVFYPVTLIDEPIRSVILGLNPLAVAVELFRYGLYAAPLDFAWYFIPIAIGSCLLYCAFALLFFFRVDPILADMV